MARRVTAALSVAAAALFLVAATLGTIGGGAHAAKDGLDHGTAQKCHVVGNRTGGPERDADPCCGHCSLLSTPLPPSAPTDVLEALRPVSTAAQIACENPLAPDGPPAACRSRAPPFFS